MEWISVKDRLPKDSGYVLCCYDDSVPWVSMFHITRGLFVEVGETISDSARPTHWMPLPEKPKEEE